MELSEQRWLEILLGDSSREEEMIDAYSSAGVDVPKYRKIHELQTSLYQSGWIERLWRAKMRFRHGSIVAIMDGLAVVEAEGAPIPNWLSSAAIENIALHSTDASKSQKLAVAKALKKEKTKLKVQRQVGVMSKLYARCKMLEQCPNAHWQDTLPDYTDAMRDEAKRSGIDLCPSGMTLERAAEISEIYLRGTPCFSSAASIWQNHKATVDSFTKVLCVSELTPSQAENLSMDLRWVTEPTKRALGLWDDLPF